MQHLACISASQFHLARFKQAIQQHQHLQLEAMQGVVNSSNRPSKADSMSDRRLTSRSTNKDLEGTQDHAVEGPGQTSSGAGAWPLQCEAQFAVPVLKSQKKCICE